MKKANDQFNKIGNAYIEDCFPFLVNHLPPHALRQGHCWFCGKMLAEQEMFPNGPPPRYMCQTCYEHFVYSWPKDKCLTCGGVLPGDQGQKRFQIPRELVYALHKGPCEDYHSTLAGIVLGLPFKTKNVPTPVPGLMHNAPMLTQFQVPQPESPFESFNVQPINPDRRVRYLRFPE